MDGSDPGTTLAIALRAVTLLVFIAIFIGMCVWLFAPLRHGRGEGGAMRVRRDGAGPGAPPGEEHRPPR